MTYPEIPDSCHFREKGEGGERGRDERGGGSSHFYLTFLPIISKLISFQCYFPAGIKHFTFKAEPNLYKNTFQLLTYGVRNLKLVQKAHKLLKNLANTYCLRAKS